MKLLQLSVLPKKAGGRNTGGVGVHSWELSQKLNERGYSVSVGSHNVITLSSGAQTIRGIRVIGVSPFLMAKALPSTLFSRRWWSNYYDYFGDLPIFTKLQFILYGVFLRGILTSLESKPDIVQIHHISYKWPFVQFELQRIYGENAPPILVSEHGFHEIMFSNDSKERKDLIQRELSETNHLLLNTRQTLQETKELFGTAILPNNIWTGINGIDVDTYTPMSTSAAKSQIGIDPDKRLVLYVGRLEDRKGINEFIEALNQLAPLEFEALIIGSGDSEKIWENVSSRCRGNIEHINYVDDLQQFYCAADLMVAPSYHEDFGLTYVESMACGTPVIGTDNVPESVIPDDETVGYRVPIRNSSEIAKSIEKGINRDWDRATILSHAAKFDWERKSSDYVNIYSTILSNNKLNQQDI